MNVVVLAGGLSPERDVSITSGTLAAKALKKNGHNVIMLDVFMGYGEEETDVSDIFSRTEDIGLLAEGIPEVSPDLEAVRAMRKDKSDCFFGPNVIAICRLADFAFLALHGENGENGKLQAALDLYGVKYTGAGYIGSALAMDKGLTKIMFNAHNIPTPEGISLKRCERKDSVQEAALSFPCVVKPCSGGSSIGVSIVRSADEYEAALDEAFKYEDEVVIEKYISGREFSVGVLEGRALPIIEIEPVEGFYDYKNKYKEGGTIETCPADLPADIAGKMQQIAVAASEVLGVSIYSRLDFLLDENGDMFCLEANTLPGMTPTSLLPQEAAAEGTSFEELVELILEISERKYK